MNEQLELACGALDTVAAAIISGWSGEQTFCEAWGWNCPAVTRKSAASIATSLADEIRAANISEIDEETAAFVAKLPSALNLVREQTIPQFWGGNNGAAYTAYLGTILTARAVLQPLLGWKTVPDPKSLPGHTVRRLRSIQAEVDALAPDKEALQRQLHDISLAHTVAENLPLDLKALADARQKVVAHADAAEAAAKRVAEADEAGRASVRTMGLNAKEAEKLINQCQEAYRVTTTKGLAAAFDQRAKRLGLTVSVWVVGLVVALGIGSYIGWHRLEALTRVLEAPPVNWASILLQAVLSFLSIGAPVWFAWLATKQIGQRFRLAEDYAFKASVAKAYEGYRREAARLDPQFEARLFSSALTRLEEAPLRLVDPATHGSPWHEALSSSAIQRTIDAIPELRDRALTLVSDAAAFLKPAKPITQKDIKDLKP